MVNLYRKIKRKNRAENTEQRIGNRKQKTERATNTQPRTTEARTHGSGT